MSHQLNYFRLSFSDVQPEPVVCDTYDLKAVDRYFHIRGEPVVKWPYGITLYYVSGHPEDYIVNALGWPVMSDRVREAVLRLGESHVQFLPIEIVQEGTGTRLTGYSVLNTMAIPPALDWDHALYREDPESPTHPVVIKPALVRRLVSEFHVFRIQEQRSLLFVSQVLKENLERIEATGMRFIRVPTF